jgi:adenine phosphoribosyltransferase
VKQKTSYMDIKKIIREVPDFPRKGIKFVDITTLLKNPNALKYVIDDICEFYKDEGITKIVSLESRGFIIGGALAYKLGAGFVPIRKKGKLPAPVVSESYELEYGFDSIEMHIDAITKDDIVLIHDDLLATGGTAMAAQNLVKKMKAELIYFSFIINLSFLETENKKQILAHKTHIVVNY